MESLVNFLNIIKEGKTLLREESRESLKLIMTGKVSGIEIAEFLTILSKRGETIDEITGMAETMRELSNHVNVDYELLDTCGTGGSGLKRFNVSTISAFVLASLGVKIAKHGNRAQSGRVGSFDLLEKLGAKIELDASKVEKTINQTNIGFMFAPLFHPAMKFVGPVRKKLNIKTVFNMLGPLTNPAQAKFQVLGVFSNEMSEKISKVLQKLGTEKSLVVHGNDGLDELTISDVTTIYEVTKDSIDKSIINPKDFNIDLSSFSEIEGGDLNENAQICIDVLQGKDKSAKSDMVVLNSAAGLYVYGKVDNIKEGVVLAREALFTKIAYEKLEEYIDISKSI